jgi:hypothetical protein
MTTPWSVPKMWDGQTVAILASGPSLTREMAELVRGKCRVIAVNNQGIPVHYKGVLEPALAPWADLLYAADAKWWNCYKDRALAFAGLKVTLKGAVPFKEVYALQQSPQRVFDERPTHIVSGGNSGYQALHVAVHTGAKRILLCGYDMVSADKRKHNHDDHPPRLNSRGNYATWLNCFAKLAPVLQAKGVKVFNCSPKSALRAFPKGDLRNLLAEGHDGIGRATASSGLSDAPRGEGSDDRRNDGDVGGSVHECAG